MPRYINPYTDFGFKRLFGTEANKALLIDFLNCLVLPEHTIDDLEFRSSEGLPATALERRSIFDIRCTARSGQRFIVEMQKANFHFFKDRALFYATFPIKEQAEVGVWDFCLQPVYLVAILDFYYDESEEKAKLLREVQLRDQDGEAFSDKLHFRFVQMPAFNKREDQLETHFDKWCFFLKNLESFDVLPAILREPIFEKGIATLWEAMLTRDELDRYEQSLKGYRDLAVHIREQVEDGKLAARTEALAEGLAAGKAEGLAVGKAEGLAEGKAEGKAEGLAEGEGRGRIALLLEAVAGGDLAPARARTLLLALEAQGKISAAQLVEANRQLEVHVR